MQRLLPDELWVKVYEFDPTYRLMFGICIANIQRSWGLMALDPWENKRYIFEDRLTFKQAYAKAGLALMSASLEQVWPTRRYPDGSLLILGVHTGSPT